MIDYSNYEQSLLAYDGLACNKIGLVKDDVYYMVKFPCNVCSLSNNVNDVVSEYVASKVVSFYMPAHEVDIGLYKGKICAVCTDFAGDVGKLLRYSELKTTLVDPIVDKFGRISNGLSPEMKDIDYTLHNNIAAKRVERVNESFWRMFILDALNGNPDRNNGNWGLLLKNNAISFSPVYDNGSALNYRWPDEKLKTVMADKEQMKTVAYHGIVCFFQHGAKKINPYQYMESGASEYLKQELLKLDFSDDMYARICAIVDQVEVISETRKDFYKELYRMRFKKMRELQLKFL